MEGDLQARFPGLRYRDLLARTYTVLESRLKEQEVHSASKQDQEGESLSQASDSPANAFARSIRYWPIFSDSAHALARLANHFKLVVLSNVDNDSFGWTHPLLSLGDYYAHEMETVEDSSSSNDLYTYPIPNPNRFWHPQEKGGSKSPFTVIFTAQDVGCYKPCLQGFLTALEYFRSQHELFGLGCLSLDEVKEKVLCVAQSLKHDIEPANELGLDAVWIDRQSGVMCNEGGEGWGKWTWRFESLEALAEAVEKEVGE